MKKLLILFALLGALTTFSFAQQLDGSVYLKQAAKGSNSAINSLTEEEFFGAFTNWPLLSQLQQWAMDANQIARITIEGDQNIAELSQLGSGNIGMINIIGNKNDAALSQNGSGLLSILNIQSDSNTLDVDQNGNALQNYIEINGDGLEFDIAQNQHGLTISQTGQGAVPLRRSCCNGANPVISE